jgi:putative sigma-54 modulation protein
VEAKVSAEHKHDFVATHQSEDMMGSIDQVLHKLEQQLRKYKKRIQDHHRGNVRQTETRGDLGPATS